MVFVIGGVYRIDLLVHKAYGLCIVPLVPLWCGVKCFMVINGTNGTQMVHMLLHQCYVLLTLGWSAWKWRNVLLSAHWRIQRRRRRWPPKGQIISG